MKKMNLWMRTNQALALFFTSLSTNALFKGNKKLLILPLIVIAFLFSCKKEKSVLLPDKNHDIEQLNARSCGTNEQLKLQLASDPGLRSKMAAIEYGMQIPSGSLQRTSGMVTIPVVVHVVYNTAEQNISDAQIQSQIAALTEDFTKTNADAATIPAAFQSLAANANIQFVLAKRDPSGNATTGITRTQTANTSFSSNNYVKFASYGGHDAWPSTQYLNIWVCNLGLCGYATYPGTAASVDGVVVKYNCFGRIGVLQSNYNKGRTTTHEVSHWFNVYHIWGDATCGDDLVNDTPTQENANYDRPIFPLASPCSINSNGDMFMNFMDYTADDARTMMTQGQVNRINATLDGPRIGLLTSLGATAPGGTTVITCNVPSGLNATSITTSNCTLTWPSTGAASYNVRYKSTASTTWITTSAASTSFYLSGLMASTNYEYQVAGVCSGVATAFSSSKLFTTLANTTIVCNVPLGLNATSITTSNCALTWPSTGAASYNVRYKSMASTTWITTAATSTSFYLSGLMASTNYEYQVASVCSGVASAFSSSKLFTTLANTTIVCNIPLGLNVFNITANNCALSWLSTGAVTYNLRYKPTTSSTWTTKSSASTSLNLSSLMASTNYEYQVASVCLGTGSAYSTSKVFTTLANATACNIPSALNVFNVTANSSLLNWLSTGAVSYNVRYKSTTSSTWIITSSASTSFYLSGLMASTNYEYQVASVCLGTGSAYSTSKVFTTLANATACNIPSGLNASNVSKYNAQLNWSSTGAASYSVRYKSTQSSTWIYMTLSSTSMGIGGLYPSTTYEFQIASKCSATVSSAYSASKLFTTTLNV